MVDFIEGKPPLTYREALDKTYKAIDKAFKSAKDIQIGGDHYKGMPIQVGEFVTKNKIPWFEANAIKYICRHKLKGGKIDLEKAIHYLQLAIEEHYGKEKT